MGVPIRGRWFQLERWVSTRGREVPIRERWVPTRERWVSTGGREVPTRERWVPTR